MTGVAAKNIRVVVVIKLHFRTDLCDDKNMKLHKNLMPVGLHISWYSYLFSQEIKDDKDKFMIDQSNKINIWMTLRNDCNVLVH